MMTDTPELLPLTKNWSFRKLNEGNPQQPRWALQYMGMDWHVISEFLSPAEDGSPTLDNDLKKFADEVAALTRVPPSTVGVEASQHQRMRNAIDAVELALNGLEIDDVVRRFESAADTVMVKLPLGALRQLGNCYPELNRIINDPAFERPTLHGGSGAALAALLAWCQIERGKLVVDGYDYKSGEEYGIRRVELQIERAIANEKEGGKSDKLFKREDRGAGYYFVTAPGFPGWSHMLTPVCPEARERDMRLSFVEFLEAEAAAFASLIAKEEGK